jgi:hypothetical protein
MSQLRRRLEGNSNDAFAAGEAAFSDEIDRPGDTNRQQGALIEAALLNTKKPTPGFETKGNNCRLTEAEPLEALNRTRNTDWVERPPLKTRLLNLRQL